MSNGSALQPDVRPREVWAWAMYDFANSGYTTVVITAVFNAYFVGVVAAGKSWGTFAWTLALSISYAIVIFSAPIVGAYADAHAAKKKLLAITTSGCVLGTALLSPHMVAANQGGTLGAAIPWAAEAALAVLRGELPERIYNTEAVVKWQARFGGKSLLGARRG